VHAVELELDDAGQFVGVIPSPLTTQRGKQVVLDHLVLERPILAVGDGSTDAAMIPAVETFAAYIGFVRRDAVVARAAVVLDSFSALVAHALSA
jgi:phosphoserine phosphatase